MNVELLRQFVELTRRKRLAEEGLDEVKEQLAALEPLVVAELAAAGVRNARVACGGRDAVVYSSTTLYARLRDGATRPQVAAALKLVPDARELVSEGYNANALSAWVRERLGDRRKPLPPSLDKLVEVRDRITAHVNEADAEPSSSARARRYVDGVNAKNHKQGASTDVQES